MKIIRKEETQYGTKLALADLDEDDVLLLRACGFNCLNLEELNVGTTIWARPNRITIPLADDTTLVAEVGMDDAYKEIFVFLEKKDGDVTQVWQDLAIIREAYGYSESDNKVIQKRGLYEVCVYGNENDEDYTECYQIAEYREDKS